MDNDLAASCVGADHGFRHDFSLFRIQKHPFPGSAQNIEAIDSRFELIVNQPVDSGNSDFSVFLQRSDECRHNPCKFDFRHLPISFP